MPPLQERVLQRGAGKLYLLKCGFAVAGEQGFVPWPKARVDPPISSIQRQTPSTSSNALFTSHFKKLAAQVPGRFSAAEGKNSFFAWSDEKRPTAPMGRRQALSICSRVFSGWGAGIRTPIPRSRVLCPAVGRLPKRTHYYMHFQEKIKPPSGNIQTRIGKITTGIPRW